MKLVDIEGNMRKTLASYSKLGVRRLAKTQQSKRSSNFYLDLTNLWKTNSDDQTKQYKAFRDSGMFSDNRMNTFINYNYRSYEPGTYSYSAAHSKIKRTRTNKKPILRGTMQVADLWSDKQMQ